MSDTFNAIQSLYPNVVTVKTTEEGIISAYDESMGPVVISMPAIEQEENRLEAEEIATEEAREAIRASALQKLVENAGLTVEEVKSFIKIEE
jgi:hypothetical protein